MMLAVFPRARLEASLDMHHVAFTQVVALLGQPFPDDHGVPVGRGHRRAVSAVPLPLSRETEIGDGFALGCRTQLDRLAEASFDDCLVHLCCVLSKCEAD